MSQLVIGLGEIGKPLFNLLSRTDKAVYGRDLEDWDEGKKIGVIHVCFPYSDDFVEQVKDYVNQYDPELVIIHSTVVPGTTREVARATANLWPIAYSPVRGRHGNMEEEMTRKYTKFISGNTTEAIAKAEARFITAGLYVDIMLPVEALELAKLLETTYTALLIGWAQEMNRFAEEFDASYPHLARFFDEVWWLPRVVFRPGVIGGHCLLQNLDLLEKVQPSVFIDAIRQSNELRILEGGSTERLQPIPHFSLLCADERTSD